MLAPLLWEPTATAQSRFFAAVRVPSGQVVAQPVFVGGMTLATSSRWPNPVWALHGTPSLETGTLVFTLEGALAGVVVDSDGPPLLVPASGVIREAERVLSAGAHEAGRLDVEVQPLSAALKAATGAPQGVVVSWTVPSGASADHLKVGDVIAAIDGAAIASIADWEARLDRIAAGQTVTLSVWRLGAAVAVPLIARSDQQAERLPLGLQLRTVPRTGAAIRSVVAQSAAHRAGLRSGDVLTRIDTLDAPTAVQAERAFRMATTGRPLLIGVTRGETHFVIAMDRRW
jgi:S1-C subfamily serine protease